MLMVYCLSLGKFYKESGKFLGNTYDCSILLFVHLFDMSNLPVDQHVLLTFFREAWTKKVVTLRNI